MILGRISLKPFGGISSKEIRFRPNLNVVLGPNEAGKTTVFEAIQHALFTPSNLKPSHFSREMERFLPVGSGDTICVELEFSTCGKRHVLKRRWGETHASELILPDGSVVSRDEEIARFIEENLTVSEGTCRSVLMSSQAGLTRTLSDLRESHPETLHSLGDILRKSVLETAGVSIDRYSERVLAAYEEHFSRWDVERGAPEKGRGIKNPYITKVGRVLGAYYERERFRTDYIEALQFEEKLDLLNREFAQASFDADGRKRYLEEHRSAVDAARKRREHRNALDLTVLRARDLREANESWPVLKSSVAEQRSRTATLESEAAGFNKELEEAQGAERVRAVRSTFERARSHRERIEKMRLALSAMKKITREDLDQLQETHISVEALKGRLSSKTVGVTFLARKDFTLSVQSGSDAPSVRKLRGGEALSLQSTGPVRIEHGDWTLEALAGEGDARSAREDLRRGEEHLSVLWERTGFRTIREASEANRRFEEESLRLRAEEEALESALGGKSYEALEAECRNLGGIPGAVPDAVSGKRESVRSLPEILRKLAGVQDALARLAAETASMENKIAGYAEKYGDQGRLLIQVAENALREEELRKNLAGLPTLPDGVEDEEEFISTYERVREEHERARDKVQKLAVEIARLEGQEPGLSSEEFGKLLGDADERFQRTLRTAQAVARIRELTEKILLEVDSSTYTGIRKKLEGYVSLLTNGRYRDVRMDGSIPEGFIRGDGKTLPYALLSTGTRDVLALALRLAMAEYFLEGKDGFVAMDDPFANLDPVRRGRAADLVRRFAEGTQLIMFTCNPGIPELLGIDPISMETPPLEKDAH